MSIGFKGTRWFKCDLHLHTPASQCFQEQSITAVQWVEKAIEQGLDCVAITDHNTGEWVDAIKQAAIGTSLTVFPGVEITCDPSKIHLLILFNVDKTTEYVNDFIIKCGIDRRMFADKLAGTTQSLFQIAKLANDEGAVVIPAHIDDYNGLASISNENLKTFFELPYINSVQVVHNQFTDKLLQTNTNEELREYLNNYYNNPTPPIDFTLMADWHKPVKKAIDKKLAITTFSDNPHAPQNPKHGIDGIGAHYTWIKMDEKPSLEGLRQAFLLPDFRVKNEFISTNIPYSHPDLWIKSISITDTTFTESPDNLKIELSPQLTTIIGGRGSGKSSILRFIRGIFNRTEDIRELSEIIKNHDDFYKLHDSRTQKGVLKDTSTIVVEFVRNNSIYRITAKNITNSHNQVVVLHKFDAATQAWVEVNSEGYLSFFEFEQYSQKQIYEVAQEPNSLKDRIDKSIPEISNIKSNMEVIKKLFFEKSAAIRTIQQKIAGKGKLQTEITDIDERITLYHKSGIASLLSAKESFTKQDVAINGFIEEAINRETSISKLIDELDIPDIDYSIFDIKHAESLTAESNALLAGYQKIKTELERLKIEAENFRTTFVTSLLTTNWKLEYEQNQENFKAKKIELESQGIDDISNFESLTEAKTLKESDLAKIVTVEANLVTELQERNNLKAEYLQKAKDITALRKQFVETYLQDEKVKVNINAFRNKNDFITKLRTTIQRDKGFDADIDALTNLCFTGIVETNLNKIVNIFKKIKKEEQVTEVTGYLVNLVKGMTESQIDDIELIIPDDEIDIKYKPSGATAFKPLSTASAGQKTTAILTLILAHGKIPLILDQPEDDLDNRLVYELIVDRLKQAKEYRQLIIVTHNANIPVNGDAEYILSMNSESKKIKVFCAGTLEQLEIKKEICDVMEGSEQAFDMRARRYKQV